MAKHFAAFDIDGTVIRWQLYHAIGDAMAKKGLIDDGTYQKVRNARMNWKVRDNDDAFLEYERQLVVAFDEGLKGMPVEQFNKLVDDVFSVYHKQVHTYTRDLIQELKEKEYLLFAVSGSPDMIVRKFVEHYGFDDFAATNYQIKENKHTAINDISLGKKSELLTNLIAKHGATKKGSIAIGDTESDIGMLELVENPIAFNPTKKLFQHAQQQGWKIVVERKNMVYEMEQVDGKYILA